MAFDKKCYDLAIAFLEDYKEEVPIIEANALAQHIQTAIEEWLEQEGYNP